MAKIKKGKKRKGGYSPVPVKDMQPLSVIQNSLDKMFGKDLTEKPYFGRIYNGGKR